MPKTIETLSVSTHTGKPCASFTVKGERARYHIWLAEGGELAATIHGAVLYKNPPRDMKPSDPGHFRTRHLNPSNDVNRPLVAAVIGRVKAEGLIAKARAEEAAREAAEAAEAVELERSRVREALHVLSNRLDAMGRHVAAGAVRGAALELDGDQLDAIGGLFA